MMPQSRTAPSSLMRATKRINNQLQTMPSLLALCLQAIALIMVLLIGNTLYLNIFQPHHIAAEQFIFVLVLLQATLATTLAYIVRMASWWRWIHFFFPMGVWILSIYTLPSSIYLAGFMITLSLYWTTFKIQVPFFPSRPAVWRAVNHLLQAQSKQQQGLSSIDIGSGLGGMPMYLAQARPQDTVEGIEIAPLPWLISRARAIISGSRARFTLGNYHALHFAQYDVVFAYLSPAAMPSLWQKARTEMRTSSLLVSLEFPIPNLAPSQIILPNQHTPKLYVYRIA